jgi:ABC-2 type transport system permease protein
MMDLALNWTGLKTLVRKEVVRIMRIWIQTIVPPAITMTLYFIIFGNLIGRRIGSMGGFDYMQYIAPGLIMMSVITNSYGNVVSSFFGAKFARHIEEMLVSPMSNATVIMGHVAGGVFRGLLVGMLVTIVALFFTKLDVQHPLITLSIVILSSTVFALAGFINAVFARKFDDISIVPTFVLTPLTYLGGVYVSGRRVLFNFPITRVLAKSIARQSDHLYGECVSLRHTRDIRYQYYLCLSDCRAFCRRPFLC